MEVRSICTKCERQNPHEVDEDGQASVACSSCATEYAVQAYQVRAMGGRRDRRSGVKNYRIRVREPDRDETLLVFDSKQDVEARSGDWLVGSYAGGKLRYLSNQTIRSYWNIQQGMGCAVLPLGALLVLAVGAAAGTRWGR